MKEKYIKLTVTYDGSAFSGFQIQPQKPTVQGELERAFALITGKKSRGVGAGRTDAGVHAFEQVVLFRTECPIPIDKLMIGLNGALPGSLRICRTEEVDCDFHPCFSARGKHYRYQFLLIKTRSPFFERFYWQIDKELDIKKMQSAAKIYIGENNFASFAKSPQKYESTVRLISESFVSIKNEIVTFDVFGAGFMHNMVRNMAKGLYLIGIGEMEESEIIELYRNQNRGRLGAPAPPGGLYMMKVMY